MESFEILEPNAVEVWTERATFTSTCLDLFEDLTPGRHLH
jgi:hypothetical protein